MIVIFMAVLFGALAGFYFDFNVYISVVSILTGLFIFIIIENKWKYAVLCMVLFIISFFSASFRNMDIYKNNELVNKDFKIVSVHGNSYVLKNGLYSFKTYIKGKYSIGDVLSIEGKVKYFPENMNEYGFNARNYNKSNGIDYKLKVNKIIKKSGGNLISRLRNDFINHVIKVLNNFLSYDNSSLMKSIILADSSYLDKNIQEEFRKAGISHILAVSGLHISVIMIFFDYILSIFNIHKIVRKITAITVTGIYIYFINMPVGAMRAYIMTICLFMDFLTKRKYSSLDALLLSAVILVIFNPFTVYSLSFIFSYLAVLSIILFLKRIEKYFPDNFIGKSIALCISVNILIFPVSMYFFYYFSLATLISNILLVPVFSIAIILSFLSIIFLPAAYVIEPFLNIILNISLNFVGWISTFDFMDISLKVFTLWDLFIYYLIIFMIYNLSFLRFLYLIRYFSIVSIFILSAVFLIMNYDNSLTADFIYVDQGDCCIISYKGRNYLIDTGGSSQPSYRPGKIYTLNYMRTHGICSIDGLFISHFDADHCDGILDIEDFVNIKNVYISYKSDSIILNNLINRGNDIFLLKKGDRIKIHDDFYFEIITDSSAFNTENDKSMVMKLIYKDKSIMFTGDISKDVERTIEDNCDILKVAHHGSRFSSDIDFLKKISPEYAIISSGIENMYNHPHSEVIRNLDSLGIKTFITSSNGQIRVKINDDIEIKTFLDNYKSKDFIIVNVLAFLIFYLLIYRMRELWNIEKFTTRI